MNPAANSIEPPYYAVIFSTTRTAVDDGYADTATHMLALATKQPGFLGVDHARGADGAGITVSYWRSEADIAAWRTHAEHSLAREAGRARWYGHYQVRVAKVERAYAWTREA